MKKINFFILLAGIYLISGGASFAFFNFSQGESPIIQSPVPTGTQSSFGGATQQLLGPKDQVCPINGAKYTKTEKDIWTTRRPLMVMIENHLDSRPQSGLSKADVVYEVVAEGAITRFMAVFYCADAAYAIKGQYDLGPVRSSRTYYLDWVSEYSDTPLYAHVGGAGPCNDPTVAAPAKALCQIEKYGWKSKETWSDLDQFALNFKVCRREPDRVGHEVATEHSMYCSSDGFWTTAAKRGLTNVNYKEVSWDKNFVSWQFKEDEPSSGSVSPEFEFWKSYKDYVVRWEYDKATNSYKRFNGGQPHIDFNNKQQLSAKNVVIQYTVEKGPIDEHKHILYTTISKGKALIFQDGKVIEGTWSKKSRQDKTLYFDKSGKEIKFNRGPIWIEVLPTTGTVNY